MTTDELRCWLDRDGRPGRFDAVTLKRGVLRDHDPLAIANSLHQLTREGVLRVRYAYQLAHGQLSQDDFETLEEAEVADTVYDLSDEPRDTAGCKIIPVYQLAEPAAV